MIGRPRQHSSGAPWLWIVPPAVFGLIAISGRLTPFPLVLSDEANYLLVTLHGYRNENFDRWEIVSALPNHLFYAIYGTLAGPQLYAHAKVLNAAFIALSAYPIYAVARSCLSVRESTWLAVLGVSTPVVSFARYFMPESLYYLGFWCAVWVTLETVGRSVWLAAAATGLVLALLSFVKPHALALAAGTGCFLLLRSGPWVNRLGTAALMVGVFCIGRALLSYFLAPTIELWAAGPTYSQIIGSPLAAGAMLVNGIGHLAALLLLAGVPLVFIVRALIQPPVHEEIVRDLTLLAVCLLVAMVAMTVYFSAALYTIAPETHPIARLHGRYYAFALPLVMIAYAASTRHATGALIPVRRMVPWSFATLASLLVIVGGYEPTLVDYPELSVVTRWPHGAIVGAVATGACIAAASLLWKRSLPWRELPVIWWAAVGLATSIALLSAPLTGRVLKPNAVDHAMSADTVLQTLRGRNDVMVVGSHAHAPDTFRVLFYLASLARARILDPGTVLGPEDIPGDTRSLILLPGIAYEGPGHVVRTGPLTTIGLR